jgi:Protein of unknown function (DUF3551)
MTRMVFAVAFVFLASSLTPAAADYYSAAPWCAVVSTGAGDVHWECMYRSIEECRSNVLAGNRGFCNPNPYFVPSNNPAASKQQKRHAGPQ